MQIKIMGNGSIFSCQGCSEYCVGRTRIEINNNKNYEEKYEDINLNKSKSSKKIITNIYIPNKQIDFSPEKNNIIQNISNKNIPIKRDSQKSKIKTEKNSENNNKENDDSQNNFTQLFNEAFRNDRNDKNNSFISPSLTKTTSLNNQTNKKIVFNNFNTDMLGFINKLRNSPKDIIDDIDNIIKSNLKKIDDKEYLISDSTNEMIKFDFNIEKIKENLMLQDSVEILKLDNKLKISNYCEASELTDKKINELILNKKKEIIKEYPESYFYPIYIKDIKLNIILLLEDYKIKEKIFYSGFSSFFITTFNERSNRFFGILCLA